MGAKAEISRYGAQEGDGDCKSHMERPPGGGKGALHTSIAKGHNEVRAIILIKKLP
jgi:hypothetical protein